MQTDVLPSPGPRGAGTSHFSGEAMVLLLLPCLIWELVAAVALLALVSLQEDHMCLRISPIS